MSDRNEEARKRAESALTDSRALSELCEQLSVGTRRERQNTATAVAMVAKADASLLVPYIDTIIDALNRPEAQTRWECLEALVLLIDHDARNCNKAIPEVEACLFDEESGPVRLAAMRFLWPRILWLR